MKCIDFVVVLNVSSKIGNLHSNKVKWTIRNCIENIGPNLNERAKDYQRLTNLI